MELNYFLPPKLIAKFPPAERGSTRLMHVNKKSLEISHAKYADLHHFLKPNDLVVLNDTKVFKARVKLKHPKTQKDFELLFLEATKDPTIWEVRIGNIAVLEPDEVITIGDFEFGFIQTQNLQYNIKFHKGNPLNFLEQYGEVAIPPYLGRETFADEISRYNTVFAAKEGSVASPTASLNLTSELINKIREKGINIGFVTLNVGWGTFAPVKGNPEEHQIHEEFIDVSPELIEQIRQTQDSGGRIVAIGTTVLRALESCVKGRQQEESTIEPYTGYTNLFIKPGFEFKVADALLTNFHAPNSSLLLLVAAFAGENLTKEIYHRAIKNEYRFLSYGDSMFIE